MSTLDGTPETSMPEALEPFDAGAAPGPEPRPSAVRPAGPPLDRVEPLNLSRRPFLNSRPVVRISLLLVVAGLALLLWNVVQFQRYLAESADKREQIAKGEREIAKQREANAELQRRLGALDLNQLNGQIEFLNDMIEERTFSWSLLLDRLSDVLPHDVRLVRLTPKKSDQDLQGSARRRVRQETGPRRVPLGISAVSRSDEALLRFVDNLFAHPSFADPNLAREEREDETSPLVRFELSVQYIPGDDSGSVVIEESPLPSAPGGTAPAQPGAPAGAAVEERP